MKLAFCLYNYFPYGGLQRDFLRIAGESLSRGHSVEVFTSSWEGEAPAGLKITLIPKKGLQNHTRQYNFHKTLQQHLQTNHFDLIVGFNKMPGLDVYYAADTCYAAKAQQQRSFLYRCTPRYQQLASFEKAVFDSDKTTQILLLSEHQQVDFINRYHTARERFHLLPPVIAKDRKLPANHEALREAYRQQWHLAQEDLLLLMVGSGFKTKGLDRVIKGLAALPNSLKQRTRLFVIGKDNPKKFIALAKKLKIINQVNFLGGQDNVADFYLAADLLVHPAYNENTGTVLLEALIYGLPVLTTANCGYADYVNQANAGTVLAMPYAQSSFNEALTTMLMTPERNLWKRNAIQFTQQTDLYCMPEKAVDFLETVER